MINSTKFHNCKVPFPAIEGLGLTETLGKVRIKNIYQTWNGENINQIRERHESNPYTLRIGMPTVDERLKSDSVYFILDYLSYNPVTKDVEQRQLIPLRNMEKLYIGQSLQEAEYKDYRLFVDGIAVVDDLYLKKYQSIGDQPVGRLLVNLVDTVEKLKLEVVDLKRQLKTQHIYK